MREEYYHTVCHSIFAHARLCNDPEAVLIYTRDTQSGLLEVQLNFPPDKSDHEEPSSTKRPQKPSWMFPIMREARGLPPDRYESANQLMSALEAVLQDQPKEGCTHPVRICTGCGNQTEKEQE